jgi:hypothetical protein
VVKRLWAVIALVAIVALVGCEAAPVERAAAPGGPGDRQVAEVERFDPLTSRVRVPDVAGLHRTEHATSAEQERILLSDLSLAGETTLVEIVVRPRGHGRPSGEATEPVNGQPAYWVDGSSAARRNPGVRLAFTWADDSWAYVGAATSPGVPTTHNTR